ncbi:putative vomeronasal receptor-like protein 4 [Gorilla gorilla gorilla]|uniref:putative vomeronasal receptor-like protein 4 n=1 Tax=Gorilla gorilla gorilla TaxID=9595 RepID=UPI002445B7CA|nr:putative vomeronasal receptor-like protein 4 [Gorilla gorilla gorilla]
MEMTKLFSYIVIKNVYYPQVSFGISANTFLLLFHIFTFAYTHRLKPIDIIITHLPLIHILLLFTQAILMSSDLFESWNIQNNDLKCKIIIFLNRVMRGVSICTACLLSMLQAITISPSTSFLEKFKHISANHTLGFILFSWVLNMVITNNLLLFIVPTPNRIGASLLFVAEHCYVLPMSYTHRSLFFILMVLRDVIFIGLMVLSSGYG